jgi:copper oxidase (laccase) domain-containing protein
MHPELHETFPALTAAGVRHAFLGRVPGVEVQVDRALALQRLDEHHLAARRALGFDERRFVIAEQTHGYGVAVVDAATPSPVPIVDGLMTKDPGVCLGIYVADCCAVFIVDPVQRVIALLHSGRKGSELGITAVAIEKMRAEYGSDPSRLVVQLSPCIRPPRYEVDFAALIRSQCEVAGVREIHDCGTCTAATPERYYSYRAERGKTGRMLALLAL